MLRLAWLRDARDAVRSATTPDLGAGVIDDAGAVVEVWCDGSGTTLDSAAGCGVVVAVPGAPRVERGIYLGRGTNNFAELNAIRHAVLLLEALDVPATCTVRIHSDSEYAIGALTKTWDVKANADLIADTKVVCRRYPGLVLRHVKGHAGNEGNEAADKLAGAAAVAQNGVYSVAHAVAILRARKVAQRAQRLTREHKILP